MTHVRLLCIRTWIYLFHDFMLKGRKEGKLYESGGCTIIILGLFLFGFAFWLIFVIINLIVNAILWIYLPIYILFFRIRHRKLLHAIQNLTINLKDMFKLNKTISDAEITRLINDSEETIKAAKAIRAPRWEDIIGQDMLKYWGVKELL